MRTKYYLLASFWCTNHRFLSSSLRAMTICFGDFHRQCTVDRPVTAGVQNSLDVVLGCWSKNSRLLRARIRSCHPQSCHLGDSPRQEYDNDDMPDIHKASHIGTSKHDRVQASKITCMALDQNGPWKHYSHGFNCYK